MFSVETLNYNGKTYGNTLGLMSDDIEDYPLSEYDYLVEAWLAWKWGLTDNEPTTGKRKIKKVIRL